MPTDLIVADIGGTNTRVARARYAAGHWSLHDTGVYPSREHPDLSGILQQWRRDRAPAGVEFRAAGLAVAGPVTPDDGDTEARVTNLRHWPALRAAALGDTLGLPVALINDFAAIGASLDALDNEHDLLRLQHGTPAPDGLRLVAGAGTGLGTCLVGPAQAPAIYAGEGGHARFSPASHDEADLAAFVAKQEGFCTREHLLSGAGIARIAAFEQARRPDAEVERALCSDDPAAAIHELAERGHPAALGVVERFVRLFGGQLADMALTALPRGGVFLAGGIAPRWSRHFQDPAFRAAFTNRPPMAHLLEPLPVALIMHPQPGLLGAAVSALRLPRESHGA
ncbi:MAG: glucokinase [Pseudomonadota bacterium]